MTKALCGEVTVDFHKNGNWQDLADILLMNGYLLEVKLENAKDPFSDKKVIISIMKEV